MKIQMNKFGSLSFNYQRTIYGVKKVNTTNAKEFLESNENEIDDVFISVSKTLANKLTKIESLLQFYQSKVDKLTKQRNKITYFLETENLPEVQLNVTSSNEDIVEETNTPQETVTDCNKVEWTDQKQLPADIVFKKKVSPKKINELVEYYFSHIRRTASFEMVRDWVKQNYPDRDHRRDSFSIRSSMKHFESKYKRVCRGWYEYVPEVPEEQYMFKSEKITKENMWSKSLTGTIEYYFTHISRAESAETLVEWIKKNTDFKHVTRKSLQSLLNLKKDTIENLGHNIYQYKPAILKPYENEKLKTYPVTGDHFDIE